MAQQKKQPSSYLFYVLVMILCTTTNSVLGDTLFESLDEPNQITKSETKDSSTLNNIFIENSKIAVYNNSEYSLNTAQQALSSGSQISLSDLSISLGYGLSYQLNSTNKIGYEYLSAFPYDRGQSLRLFWSWTF